MTTYRADDQIGALVKTLNDFDQTAAEAVGEDWRTLAQDARRFAAYCNRRGAEVDERRAQVGAVEPEEVTETYPGFLVLVIALRNNGLEMKRYFTDESIQEGNELIKRAGRIEATGILEIDRTIVIYRKKVESYEATDPTSNLLPLFRDVLQACEKALGSPVTRGPA